MERARPRAKDSTANNPWESTQDEIPWLIPQKMSTKQMTVRHQTSQWWAKEFSCHHETKGQDPELIGILIPVIRGMGLWITIIVSNGKQSLHFLSTCVCQWTDSSCPSKILKYLSEWNDKNILKIMYSHLELWITKVKIFYYKSKFCNRPLLHVSCGLHTSCLSVAGASKRWPTQHSFPKTLNSKLYSLTELKSPVCIWSEH